MSRYPAQATSDRLILSWLAMAIIVLVAASYPSWLAMPVRLSLGLVLLYLLLMNVDKIAGPLQRLADGLKGV